ncbi:pyrimidine/purine nucleoside phosphorylase [Glaciimonas soli]|uniref:Pyrimidine/purine nucleoside phosphorylase n=1 Tax=Glaciimonas soli TaxID=2590999 RepID=A0A843YVR4_9BURK|nr:pyrimidine/purine nucleoside phosphorylase [Glaciimonas soli]MQR01588.1 DUF1255 family protein [Glaciimonas soli]
MKSQLDHVSVLKQANVYFDGKCVSHTVITANGDKKTLGVILPSSLTFNTNAAEVMEITSGICRVRLLGQQIWTKYSAGDRFEVAANSRFDIEVVETLNYVCHFV